MHWNKIVAKTFVFSIFLFLLLWINRLFFIICGGIIYDGLNDFAFIEIFKVFLYSICFDGYQILSISIIYALLHYIFRNNKYINVILYLFVSMIFLFYLFLNILNIGFFETYGDTFNAILLDVVLYDATFDIPYIYLKILLCVGLYYAFMRLYARINSQINLHYNYSTILNSLDNKNRINIFKNLALISIMMASLIYFYNQLYINSPTQNSKLNSIDNQFLRLILPGSFNNLYTLYADYNQIKNIQSTTNNDDLTHNILEYLNTDSLPSSELESIFSNRVKSSIDSTLDKNISHIFYIIVDDLTSKQIHNKYENMPEDKTLHSLIKNKKMLFVDNFLQNGKTPKSNIQTHITGIPQSDTPANTLIGHIRTQNTSPANIFNTLNFDTKLYYTQDKNYYKLTQYAKQQGFKEVFNKQDINDYKLAQHKQNIFKENPNEILLDLLLSHLKINKTKSFNMILLSNIYKDRTEMIAQNDKMIMSFIDNVLKIAPKSLFVITGNSTQTSEINDLSAFLIYSPTQKIEKLSNVASSVDILPSILELSAPYDFKYMSFGRARFGLQPFVISNEDYALGDGLIATNRFIYNGINIKYIAKNIERTSDEELANMLYNKMNILKRLSFYALINGIKNIRR